MSCWTLTCAINDQRKQWSFGTRAKAREIAKKYRAHGWRTSVTR